MSAPTQVTIDVSTSSQPIQSSTNFPPATLPKITLNGVAVPTPEGKPYIPCGVQTVVFNSTMDMTNPASVISNKLFVTGESGGGWYATYQGMWSHVATQLLSSGNPQDQAVILATFGLDVDMMPTPTILELLLGQGAGPQLQTWASTPFVSEGGYFIQYPANYVLIGNSGLGYAEGSEAFGYNGQTEPLTTTVSATIPNG